MDTLDLEDLCLHINTNISIIKKSFQLRNIGQDPSLRNALTKVGHEMHSLCDLLNKMKQEVQRQETIANSLKELEVSLSRHTSDIGHIVDNIPPHLPKKSASSNDAPAVEPAECKVTVPEPAKKATKERIIKEMELITVKEFETIPPYRKNRLTYEQINNIIEEFNKAVVGKYKILYQPIKSLNNTAKKQVCRFKEQETKDTKGQFFIVEQDIKEFTPVKVDKRFSGFISILQHCHRLREIRGKGLVQYIICYVALCLLKIWIYVQVQNLEKDKKK